MTKLCFVLAFSYLFYTIKTRQKNPPSTAIPITFPQAPRNRTVVTRGIFFRRFNCYKNRYLWFSGIAEIVWDGFPIP